MPSTDHELPLELFRNRPELAPELLETLFGLKVPAHTQVRLGSETLNDCDPTEYRCDATVILGDPGASQLAIIVEVQLRARVQDLDRKRYTWPVYLATLRARQECPVTLLVLCPDAETAAKCAELIETGHPGWDLKPLVINLAKSPAVTNADKAREMPELAVLSVVSHADGPDGRAVLEAFCAGMETLKHRADVGAKYYEYVLSRLSAAAQRSLEEILTTDTYEYQSAFAREYFGQGKAEGKAEGEVQGEARALLSFLAGRGLPVSEQARAQITSCTDLDRLDHWIKRAATACSVEDLFD
ncbi:hypothetical protein ACRYCC_04925 [Actinomadura scrupuli]|uniref:hypothetical protein n=1 Tax=Actinomadura scrupuli TaxID=559629 RepID=UPI003D994155